MSQLTDVFCRLYLNNECIRESNSFIDILLHIKCVYTSKGDVYKIIFYDKDNSLTHSIIINSNDKYNLFHNIFDYKAH